MATSPRGSFLGLPPQAVAIGAFALGGLPAYGDDDDAGPTATEVTAVDYRFENLPDTVPAGTTLSLRHTAETELHELVSIRLAEVEEHSVEELTALPPEEMGPTLYAHDPALVLLAPAVGEQIVAVAMARCPHRVGTWCCA